MEYTVLIKMRDIWGGLIKDVETIEVMSDNVYIFASFVFFKYYRFKIKVKELNCNY